MALKEFRCFACKQGGHFAANCPNTSKNIRCFNCNQDGHWKSNCPSTPKQWGACFICGDVNHSVSTCPKRCQSNPFSQSTTDKKAELKLVHSELTPDFKVNLLFLDQNCITVEHSTAILDSGSPISIIKNKLVKHFDQSSLNENFVGINGSQLTILGKINTVIKVNDMSINHMFFVVPDSTMSSSCLLGRDFISNEGKLTKTIFI